MRMGICISCIAVKKDIPDGLCEAHAAAKSAELIQDSDIDLEWFLIELSD